MNNDYCHVAEQISKYADEPSLDSYSDRIQHLMKGGELRIKGENVDLLLLNKFIENSFPAALAEIKGGLESKGREAYALQIRALQELYS